MSGRKRKSPSETDSRAPAAAKKKVKKQHSEAQANITPQIASGSPGPSRATDIMDSNISTPTTGFLVDTVNSTTNPPSVNPIITPNTISSTQSEQAEIASGLPGPSGTTVIMDSSISTPTTSLSVDTVISTTNPPSLNPIMTPNTTSSTRSEQDTSNITSEENNHLSEFMNGTVRSLSVARIQQKYVKRHNKIIAILCGILKIPPMEFVGSIAEGTDSESDKDTIWFSDNHDDFESLELKFLPEEGHPGYSKIHVENLPDNSELKDYTDTKDGKIYLKNSVRKKFLIDKALSNVPFELNSHGAAYTAEMHDIYGESLFPNKKKEVVDHVFCIKCTKWPKQADEWKNRKRASNWPTRQLVQKITQSGCLLTAVGSKESKESEIQWRVSFNKAERQIIESFNETQIHCILLLKLLKKKISEIAGKNITSYIMKNIMFWCLEESSNDYWKPSNLVSCFRLCVSKLQSVVENKLLPNYFIQKRNLIIASEFTDDIQTKTKQYLKNVHEDPTTCIRLLLPDYKKSTNNEMCLLYYMSQKNFIETWIETQIYMAHGDQSNFGLALVKLYDGYNIQYNLKRCNAALEKLTTVRYAQPLIKKLQNYLGVLHYLLLKEENKTGEHRTDSDTRKKYFNYMKLSASGDLTHNTLRMATCYLDDGAKEDCLNIIRTVTDSDGHFFMQTHEERLRQTLHCDISAFRKKQHTAVEIALYTFILYYIDFMYHNPYTNTEAFESLKKRGILLIGYDTLSLAWKRSYFDVTFMQAELPVLPKPAALELCFDHGQKHVSFHPFLYRLLLEFLCHHKNESEKKEKESVLEKMKNCVSELPDVHKSRALNFITYCCVLQKDYYSASRYLIRSFKLNPVKQNVAYMHVKYILSLLRLA